MMDGIVEHEMAVRDGGGCGCSGATLDVLKEVQRAYEHRMELLNSSSGSNKLQKQVQLLQSWVSDLVGQNALLARTVEQLEADVMSRLLLERRRHAEMECELRAEARALRRRVALKEEDVRGLLELLRRLRDPAHPRNPIGNIHFNERNKCNAYDSFNETKILNEALQNEIATKDREIRRLSKETQQHEQTIMSLRKEVSLVKYHTPETSKLDAEVTADICCPGMQIGDVTPVKDYPSQLRQETAKYHEQLTEMEESVKSSAEKVRALREANVALNKEVYNLRQICFALGEQCQSAVVRSRFLEEVVREMRRQLRQAKAKLKEATEAIGPRVVRETASNLEVDGHSVSYDSIASACVRQQPRRAHGARHILELESYACGIPGFGGSENEASARAE